MHDDPLLKIAQMTAQALRLIFLVAACALVIGFLTSLAGNDPVFARVEADLLRKGLHLDGRLGLGVSLGAAALMLLLGERFMFKLHGILSSIPAGDPFQMANAHRLQTMGWLAFAIQVLGSVIDHFSLEAAKIGMGLKLGSSLTLSGIFLILLLFSLARVFKIGSAMRSDLEGTV